MRQYGCIRLAAGRAPNACRQRMFDTLAAAAARYACRAAAACLQRARSWQCRNARLLQLSVLLAAAPAPATVRLMYGVQPSRLATTEQLLPVIAAAAAAAAKQL